MLAAFSPPTPIYAGRAKLIQLRESRHTETGGTRSLRSEEITRQAQPLPRDWARLIQKLRWIGLDEEARLELAVSTLPLEQRCELDFDPTDTD